MAKLQKFLCLALLICLSMVYASDEEIDIDEGRRIKVDERINFVGDDEEIDIDEGRGARGIKVDERINLFVEPFNEYENKNDKIDIEIQELNLSSELPSDFISFCFTHSSFDHVDELIPDNNILTETESMVSVGMNNNEIQLLQIPSGVNPFLEIVRHLLKKKILKGKCYLHVEQDCAADVDCFWDNDQCKENETYLQTEQYLCNFCLYAYPNKNIFILEQNQNVCYECIRKYFSHKNQEVQNLVFRHELDHETTATLKVIDILKSDDTYKEDNLIWQAIANGVLSYISAITHYELDKSSELTNMMRILQPFFFGYISVTSILHGLYIYRRRITEFPFTLSLTHCGTIIQIFYAVVLGILKLLYPSDNTEYIVQITIFFCTIVSAWALWSANGFNLKIYESHYLLFHELYPQSMLTNPSQNVLELVITDNNTEKKKFCAALQFIFQRLFIFFNFVCACTLLNHYNDEGEFAIQNGDMVKKLLVGNFCVWATIFIYWMKEITVITQPLVLTFNNLTRLIILTAFTSLKSFDSQLKLELGLGEIFTGIVGYVFCFSLCECCKKQSDDLELGGTEVSKISTATLGFVFQQLVIFFNFVCAFTLLYHYNDAGEFAIDDPGMSKRLLVGNVCVWTSLMIHLWAKMIKNIHPVLNIDNWIRLFFLSLSLLSLVASYFIDPQLKLEIGLGSMVTGIMAYLVFAIYNLFWE